MPTYKVTLERTHTSEDNVVKKKTGSMIVTAKDEESGKISALDFASSMQGNQVIFKDSGMQDGEYNVSVLSIALD